MSFLEPRRYNFPLTWIGGSLGDFRKCGTYDRYSLAEIPPLPESEFEGDFEWLTCHPSPMTFDPSFRDFYSIDKWHAESAKKRDALIRECESNKLRIPESFFHFMDNADLVTRIRHPMDGWFEYPLEVIPNPTVHAGHFVQFFRDSQDCWLWYLFIDPEDNCVVVASSEFLDETDDEFWENEREEIVLCALSFESFESFVYRLWIESEIRFRLLNNDQPLTSPMIEYIHFYDPNAGVVG